MYIRIMWTITNICLGSSVTVKQFDGLYIFGTEGVTNNLGTFGARSKKENFGFQR